MKEVGLVAKGPGWELAPPDMKLWGVNDSVWRDENIDVCFFMLFYYYYLFFFYVSNLLIF